MEAIILAGDVAAGDRIVLPDAENTVLVKQVRLGQGGFILTVVPADDDQPSSERLVTLTAGVRLRKTSLLPRGPAAGLTYRNFSAGATEPRRRGREDQAP